MNKEEIIKRYKQLIDRALSGTDNEDDHARYDDVLDDLIRELGYEELISFAEQLMEKRKISFWYA